MAKTLNSFKRKPILKGLRIMISVVGRDSTWWFYDSFQVPWFL